MPLVFHFRPACRSKGPSLFILADFLLRPERSTPQSRGRGSQHQYSVENSPYHLSNLQKTVAGTTLSRFVEKHFWGCRSVYFSRYVEIDERLVSLGEVETSFVCDCCFLMVNEMTEDCADSSFCYY